MKTFFVAYTVLKFGVPTIVNAHTSEFDLDTLEGIEKGYRPAWTSSPWWPAVTAGTPVGSLGVIGPQRMDYGRVIPLVEYMSRILSSVLEDT